MKRLSYSVFCAILLLLTACRTQTPPPPTKTPTLTLTPTATLTPVPTWTLTLTPTPTPIPPLVVNITWPEEVSALEPPLLIADVTLPQRITTDIAMSAKIYDPTMTVTTTFDLVQQSGRRYVAPAPFQLSLDTPTGHWWLVVHVETELDVVGERMLPFKTAPIEFRALTETLPSGVNLRIPLAFTEATAQGDQHAGGRVWQYGNGEIALWWAPGPTEALLLNNAVVMLEATHDPDAPPEAEFVEETEWQGQAAFLFQEQWPGREGGPAKVWVIQGADYWLYVLRTRAVGVDPIPPLLEEIAATFVFNEE
ncbi:MAG: hypothetical protein JXR84_08560 [Anaerolineae bacterium]|nr:hypothetical protein [Anaerolineae bacterium]